MDNSNSSELAASNGSTFKMHKEVVREVGLQLERNELEHVNIVENTNNNRSSLHFNNKQITENDTFEVFDNLLQEVEHFKESGVRIKRSKNHVYIIRRVGKGVKITKTIPIYSDKPVNNYNVSYIIANKNACNGDKVFILTMVLVQHKETKWRRILREYWGQEKVVNGKRIQHIFLLGKIRNETRQQETEKESQIFGDIVQGNFEDSYLNLTLKTLFGFQWIRDFCQNTTFVLKIDSDILVNYRSLVPHLVESPTASFVEGHHTSAQPVRNKYRRWYTPEELYPESTYAPYAAGPSYLMSSDVSTNILQTAPFVRFMPWEDVYVGLILYKLKIEIKHSNSYMYSIENIGVMSRICQIRKHFTFLVERRISDARIKSIVSAWRMKENFCSYLGLH
ncbi:beta-1,3-galactosyltransferase 1-like [Antedon mediterranea]|uniref:beta-1,3-galactosyltransferase 1-like n=1 Tax=Antedon mediterranea TaxID=105859 RepID=UPI003AF71098